MQVVLFALEDGVRLEVNLYVKVAGRAAVDAMLAFTGKPDTIAFIDPGRDFDGQRLVLLGAAGAVA
jgi:hypothetical protein